MSTTYDRTSPQDAHLRLDGHEKTHLEIKKVLVELQESDAETKQWQNKKDDAIKTIKNWFIGGIVVYIAQVIGFVDGIKILLGFVG